MKLKSFKDIIYYGVWNSCSGGVKPEVSTLVCSQVIAKCRLKVHRGAFDQVWDQVWDQINEA